MPGENSPTAPSVFAAAMSGALAEARTCLVGEIVTYDAATQKATVKIVNREIAEDENGERVTEPGPILADVPIQFLGAGVGNDAWRITWPVRPGDKVRVEFLSSSHDNWFARGGSDVDPEDDRHHSLNDAIGVTGVHCFAEIPTDAPLDALVIHGDAIKLGSSGASELVAWQSALEGLADVFANWTPVSMDGGAALKALLTTLISSGWPQGSTKVKAE